MPDAPQFIDTQGNIVELRPEQLRYAKDLGYVQASDKQVAQHQLEEKYSSFPEQLKTAAEGAAQALTLGFSTHAEKALGVDRSAIRLREQTNPIAHGIGTGIGIAAPLVLSGGAAAPAEAASLSAPSLIAGTGRAVTGALEAALPEATGLLGRAASRAAALGAGSAAEGALWSTGQLIHEQALGDPHLTAQRVVSQIGLGALLGGGLGGALGAAEVGLPKAIAASREALGNLADTSRKAVMDYYPEVASKITGRTPEEIAEILQTGGRKNLLKPEFAKEFTDSVGATHAANEEAIDAWHETMKPKQLEAMLKDSDSTAVIGQAQEHINDLRTYAQEIRSQPHLPQGYGGKAELMADALEKSLKGETNAQLVFEKLDDFKRQLYHYGKPVADPFANEAAQGMRNLHQSFKNGLENEGVWGKAGALQAKVNGAETLLRDSQDKVASEFTTRGQFDPKKALTFFKNVNDPATGDLRGKLVDEWVEHSQNYNAALEESHKFVPTGDYSPSAHEELIENTADNIQRARKEAHLSEIMKQMGGQGIGGLTGVAESMLGHNVLGPLGLALGPLHAAGEYFSNPPRVAEVLGKLQRLSTAADAAIQNSTEGIVKGLAEAGAKRTGKLGAGLSKAAFAEHAEEIHSLAANPEALQEKMTSATQHIYPHAPQTADGLHMATVSAVGFLDSKLPKHEQLGPLAQKWEPSAAEIAQYNVYKTAVEKPLSILEHAKSGRLSPQEVEAVSTVYPKLMDQMRSAAMSAIAKHPNDIPYSSRQSLSTLLGQDLDGSHAGLLANQRVSQTPSPQPPGAVKGAGKPEKLTLSRRMMTPMTAAATRERPK